MFILILGEGMNLAIFLFEEALCFAFLITVVAELKIAIGDAITTVGIAKFITFAFYRTHCEANYAMADVALFLRVD